MMPGALPPKLGRYEVLEELGKGSMGVVYLARDPLIGRLVALKTFHVAQGIGDEQKAHFQARFLREAQSCGILNHPNIVTIHDIVVPEDGADVFIAMEYVRGSNLKQLLHASGQPPLEFTARIVSQVAQALDYAHSKGVVHRDVKPANILLTADNETKLTDFGIALLNTSNLTQAGQMLGTPNYMAPEQVRGGEVTHRADIFALGVVLYELLTRRKPFAGDNLTMVTYRIVNEAFEPPEQYIGALVPGLREILEKALAKEPGERYATAGELASDLERVLPATRGRAVGEQTQSLVAETMASFAGEPLPMPEALGPDAARSPQATHVTGTRPAGEDALPASDPESPEPPSLPDLPPPPSLPKPSSGPEAPEAPEEPAATVFDPEVMIAAAAGEQEAPASDDSSLPPPLPAAARAPRAARSVPDRPPPLAPTARPESPKKPRHSPPEADESATAVGPPRPPAAGASRSPDRRKLLLAGAAAVVVLTLLALLLIGLGGDESEDREAVYAGERARVEERLGRLMSEGAALLGDDRLDQAEARFAEAEALARERREAVVAEHRRLLGEEHPELAAKRSAELESLASVLEASEMQLAATAGRRLALQVETTRAELVDRRLEEARAALEEERFADALRAAQAVLEADPARDEAYALLAAAEPALEREDRAGVRRTPPPQPAPEPEPEPAEPRVALEPPPPEPVVTTAKLRVELISDLPKGVLLIYLNDEQLLRENFRFTEKSGFFSRAKSYTGHLERSFEVEPGVNTLKVYVSGARNRPTEVEQLEANFPAGSDRRLLLRVDEDGNLEASLR